MLVVGAAAWQNPQRQRAAGVDSRPALLAPALFVAVAIAILTYDHFARLNLVAIGLAVATLLGPAVRTVLPFPELPSLADSPRHAVTADLTELSTTPPLT